MSKAFILAQWLPMSCSCATQSLRLWVPVLAWCWHAGHYTGQEKSDKRLKDGRKVPRKGMHLGCKFSNSLRILSFDSKSSEQAYTDFLLRFHGWNSVHQSSSHSNWASPLLWGAIWIGAQVLWRKTGIVAQQRQTCTWKARINLNEESIFHTFPTSASRESFIDFSKPSKMIWYSKGLNELRHVILGCQIYVPDLEYATTYYFRLLGRAAWSCPGVSTCVSCHWSPELPNISASL